MRVGVCWRVCEGGRDGGCVRVGVHWRVREGGSVLEGV